MTRYVCITNGGSGALSTFLEGSGLWQYNIELELWISTREPNNTELNAARGAGGNQSRQIVIPLNRIVNSLA